MRHNFWAALADFAFKRARTYPLPQDKADRQLQIMRAMNADIGDIRRALERDSRKRGV